MLLITVYIGNITLCFYCIILYLQVREQSKQNATKIRQAVQDEKDRQIQKLAVELQVNKNRIRSNSLFLLEDFQSFSMTIHCPYLKKCGM